MEQNLKHFSRKAFEQENSEALSLENKLKDTTITKITQLNRDERLVEIAQILSGENPSQAAIDNARELLN